jgi:hypothetical protein
VAPRLLADVAAVQLALDILLEGAVALGAAADGLFVLDALREEARQLGLALGALALSHADALGGLLDGGVEVGEAVEQLWFGSGLRSCLRTLAVVASLLVHVDE